MANGGRIPLSPWARRSEALARHLGLQAHPEGGKFAELHRSQQRVDPLDGRPLRSALTSIDFLLLRGQFSAWHRVASDEAWHLLEGPGRRAALRLWLLPPTLDAVQCVTLAPVDGHGHRPRHVVPAHWWQAAEPLGDFAYVGATVGPGFEFVDFSFGRDDDALLDALMALEPDLTRLL